MINIWEMKKLEFSSLEHCRTIFIPGQDQTIRSQSQLLQGVVNDLPGLRVKVSIAAQDPDLIWEEDKFNM